MTDLLSEWLAKAKDKTLAEPVIIYLAKRADEDEGLAKDMEGKKWEACEAYIYKKAKELAKNSKFAAVKDEVVYEWAEDFCRMEYIPEEPKPAYVPRPIPTYTPPVIKKEEKKQLSLFDMV